GNAASGVPDNAESLASPSSIRKDLAQKLVDTQNQIQVLEVRRNKIAKAESVVGQQLTALPDIARRYTDLQQQLKVATESLGRFLTVQETLQVEKARTSTSWKKM
ncbi:MAG TPA: protein tyrosine kinase, partial [Cyanobacteria bacterium UBA8553]|nr:protein tyrosine kinase [Cyanobacteria bacterium UBA8553]